MCVVSMIMDHYDDSWRRRWEEAQKQQPPPIYAPIPQPPMISPSEIDEFKRLLERAREYDKRNNEPDCELESKKEKLRDLAKQLGVEIIPP